MNCKCNDGSHNAGTAIWHRAYCAWYDHDRAGHRVRAAIAGWIADRVAHFA